jgi:hypothetical protein
VRIQNRSPALDDVIVSIQTRPILPWTCSLYTLSDDNEHPVWFAGPSLVDGRTPSENSLLGVDLEVQVLQGTPHKRHRCRIVGCQLASSSARECHTDDTTGSHQYDCWLPASSTARVRHTDDTTGSHSTMVGWQIVVAHGNATHTRHSNR